MMGLFFEHDILCYIGGTARYCIDHIFNTDSKKKSLKSYWTYKNEQEPQTEFLDAILGGFAIGIVIFIAVSISEFFY